MRTLVERVVSAHGGRTSWQEVGQLEAGVRTGGLAFAVRGVREPIELTAAVAADAPRAVLSGWPAATSRAIFADGHVRLDGGAPRPVPTPRRLRWDPEDTLAFCAMALWNYLTQPLLLLRPDVTVDERPTALDVRFPAGLPTHSARQRFHAAPDGLVVRHDYTAGAFGPLARAAHLCAQHVAVDGLVIATRRRVVPRFAGRALPGPTLVWIELDRLRATT